MPCPFYLIPFPLRLPLRYLKGNQQFPYRNRDLRWQAVQLLNAIQEQVL
jgi:hypothetical protein